MSFKGDLLHLLIRVRDHFHFFSSDLEFQILTIVLCTPSFMKRKLPVVQACQTLGPQAACLIYLACVGR